MNDAELIATAALVIADVAETITANQDRAQTGQAMAYGGFHPNVHTEILAAELVRRGVRIYPGGPGELDSTLYGQKDMKAASEKPRATDILVDTANPTVLDETMQTFGCVLLGGPDQFVRHEGHYVLRAFGDPDFVEFVIQNQGYGKVVRRLPEIL